MPARQPRLTGDQRRAMAQVLAERYRDGASIRSLAVETGRSYGLVQRLLAEAGVEFRPRGGADPASPATRAERDEEHCRPREDPLEQGEEPGEQPRRPRKEQQVAKEPVSGEELTKAEAKVRKAEQRLGKALRARAKLTKANSSKKERRAAKQKVAKRRLKTEKAAGRLERIREQMDAHSGR